MNLPPRLQRGATSLVVIVLLLFASLLALLYLSRGILFEQRTSANQMRSTQALEMAEAGIEWATGMLNSPYDIDGNCALQTTAVESFRKRYVMTAWNATPTPSSDIVPSPANPSCRFTSAGLTCSCPVNTSNAVPVIAGTGGSFSVAFSAVAGETESVRVVAWGCTATDGGTACNTANAATADANARIEVILKLRPVLRAAPASPLTCGTTCTVGGSYNITNRDVPTNGVLINAGDGITTAPGTSMATLPGQPTGNALIGNDASLASLASSDTTCSNSKMFQAYFGSTIEIYRDAPSTKPISCTSAADCKGRIDAAYAEGWRAFYFNSDLHLSGNGSLGTQADPVTLVTPNAMNINGDWTLYGLVFSNSANWNDLGTGSAVIEGAQISCAAYKNNGNGTINYNPDALKNARRFTAIMVRVPGSWKDFE
jgi:hypothetical protein